MLDEEIRGVLFMILKTHKNVYVLDGTLFFPHFKPTKVSKAGKNVISFRQDSQIGFLSANILNEGKRYDTTLCKSPLSPFPFCIPLSNKSN